MRRFLSIIFALACWFNSSGQSFVYADPMVTQPYFLDTGDSLINPYELNIGNIVRLRLGLYNADPFSAIPAQNTRVQISLGPHLQLVNLVNNGDASLNSVFAWTVTSTAGGQVLIGTQTGTMPKDYHPEVEFKLQVTGVTPAEGSTLSATFSITNQNPNGSLVFDEYPENNHQTMKYAVQSIVLPVTLVDFTVTTANCTAKLKWKVAQEINVSHYEVMVNGKSVAAIPASGNSEYNSSYDLPEHLRGQAVFVQLRMVDRDARFALSDARFISGSCNNGHQLVLKAYPNPVTTGNSIIIAAKEGSFNGRYMLELTDNSGRRYQREEVQVNNGTTISFKFKNALSPGKYIISISNSDGAAVGILPFIKGER